MGRVSQVWARANPVEGEMGARLLREIRDRGIDLVGMPRVGEWANAVYMSPIP